MIFGNQVLACLM
uniref:Uncharacterized protein n=1 Tax=Rhizophora mucronata TaxID=61149 RepID=A0A2P2QIN1_RHIMU